MKASGIIKGVAMNWASLVVGVLVGFFLAPFIVHRLGDVAYGVWVLVTSLIAYLKLLDLGLRGAVVRFVSRGHAQGNHGEAGAAVSAALWFRVRVTAVVIALTGALALLFPRLFHIPAELAQRAQLALIFVACTTAITLVGGIFASVLAAMPRYDLISGVEMLQTAARVAGIVVILGRGYGIVGLAMWECVCALAASLALFWLSRREYPELKITLGRPRPEMLRQIWNYSAWIFVLHISAQLVYASDNIVVGAYLSAAMVTLYAIGGSLARYADQVVDCLATTFTPLASRFEAAGDTARLRAVLLRGTQATMLVSLPILITLFLRGHTFINLWMGHSYGEASGAVLQILVLARVFAFANLASSGIALGLAKHKPVALVAIAEGGANLLLSIILVRKIGIMGVAWGTTLPSLATQLIFWPRYVSKITGVNLWEYLLQSWAKPMLAAAPFAVATWAAEQYWPANHLLQFFAQTAALCLLYAACAYGGFRDLLRLGRQRRVSEAAAT